MFSALTSFLVAAIAVTGCRSNESSSLASTPAAPAAPAAPAGSTTGAAPVPVPPAGGDAPAPNPTPISFNGFSQPTAADAPAITAKAAILVDRYGRVLYEKNADVRLPCASTQKLILGLMVAEQGNLNGMMTIQEPDTWCEPTMMGIQPGEVYRRGDLLHAVLVRSSNDIARALARDHSGSVSAFAANANAKARSLGMHNSYFTNASGLPKPPGQYSTCRDLSKLALASQRNPFVRQAVSTRSFVFRFPDGRTRTINNTNMVLRHWPYCTGMKTGYTNAAGKCLVSSASGNGRSVIAVILGSKTPTIWNETQALLSYGLGI